MSIVSVTRLVGMHQSLGTGNISATANVKRNASVTGQYEDLDLCREERLRSVPGQEDLGHRSTDSAPVHQILLDWLKHVLP